MVSLRYRHPSPLRNRLQFLNTSFSNLVPREVGENAGNEVGLSVTLNWVTIGIVVQGS